MNTYYCPHCFSKNFAASMPQSCANPSCLKSFNVTIAQKSTPSYTASPQQYVEPQRNIPRKQLASRVRAADPDDEYVELPEINELAAEIEGPRKMKGQSAKDVILGSGPIGHGSRPRQKLSKKKAQEQYEREAGHKRFGRESIDVTPEGGIGNLGE